MNAAGCVHCSVLQNFPVICSCWPGLVLRKGMLLSSQELILQISSKFKLDFAGKNKSFIGKKLEFIGLEEM